MYVSSKEVAVRTKRRRRFGINKKRCELVRVELVLTGLLIITRYRAWPEHSWDGGCRTSCMIRKEAAGGTGQGIRV